MRSFPPRAETICIKSASEISPSFAAFDSASMASIGFISFPVASAAATTSGAYFWSMPLRDCTDSSVAVTPSEISVVVSPRILRISALAAVAAFVPLSCVVAVIVPSMAMVSSMDIPAIEATLATMGKPSAIF